MSADGVQPLTGGPAVSRLLRRTARGLGRTGETATIAYSQPWGLVLIAAILGMVLPMAAAALGTRRGAGEVTAKRGANSRRGGLSAARRVLRRMLGKEPGRRWRSLFFSALLAIALASTNAAVVAQSYAHRDYMTALANRNPEDFTRGLGRALMLLALASPARSLVEIAMGGLDIAWRDALTEGLLSDYFKPRAVYWLRREDLVADPDTRIAVEAGHFADVAVLMARDLLENSMKLLGFIGVVYTVSAPLCGVMAAYAMLGAAATAYLFGRPLVRLDRAIRGQEAAFRASLARCRDRAEALALSCGEEAEGVAASNQYARLRHSLWVRAWWRTGLGSFRDCFGWAAYLVPIFFVAPLWLRGEVEFGVISQTVMAFQASLGALTVVVRKFRSVSSLAAEGGRLEGLAEALGRATTAVPAPEPRQGGSGVELQGVTLALPSGEQLCTDLSFAVRPGQRLLVLGESGSGKTTLVRSLAGLWAHGSGWVRCPTSTVFLSQEPYLPRGTLRRVLSFPTAEGVFNDAAVTQAARRCRLDGVLKRYSLDATEDWDVVLSRGEQQRCTFCRVLLLEPDVAVFDEATSALDEATELALYAELRSRTVVSVSHRPQLRAAHTHVLRKEGDSWRFEEAT